MVWSIREWPRISWRVVATLTEALALAKPEGYVRTFVDEGPSMTDLLSATLEARKRDRLRAAPRAETRRPAVGRRRAPDPHMVPSGSLRERVEGAGLRSERFPDPPFVSHAFPTAGCQIIPGSLASAGGAGGRRAARRTTSILRVVTGHRRVDPLISDPRKLHFEPPDSIGPPALALHSRPISRISAGYTIRYRNGLIAAM